MLAVLQAFVKSRIAADRNFRGEIQGHMDNIIRNQVISDVFQMVDREDGYLCLTKPGMDYDVAVFLSELKTFKCRGSQEQLESLGFSRVGSATATKVQGGKVDVVSVNYYKGSLFFGNFYFHDITVCLEGTASRLQFFLPKRLFTALGVDLIHQMACLTTESNYVNMESIIQQFNTAAEEDMSNSGRTV